MGFDEGLLIPKPAYGHLQLTEFVGPLQKTLLFNNPDFILGYLICMSHSGSSYPSPVQFPQTKILTTEINGFLSSLVAHLGYFM